jgi:hypothetical protein
MSRGLGAMQRAILEAFARLSEEPEDPPERRRIYVDSRGVVYEDTQACHVSWLRGELARQWNGWREDEWREVHVPGGYVTIRLATPVRVQRRTFTASFSRALHTLLLCGRLAPVSCQYARNGTPTASPGMLPTHGVEYVAKC